jgi:hypothetical protein
LTTAEPAVYFSSLFVCSFERVRGDLRQLAPRKKLLNSSERVGKKPRADLARGFFHLPLVEAG